MQNQRGVEEASAAKLWKKKTSQQKAPVLQKEGNKAKRIQDLGAVPIQNGLKPTKRAPSKEVTPLFQHSEKSPEFSPDTSTSGNEYRALRRKYLLLEEESFSLGKELSEAEDEINALEEEKLTLLDELLVLEGLVNPSATQ